jgi:hypothetical protein
MTASIIGPRVFGSAVRTTLPPAPRKRTARTGIEVGDLHRHTEVVGNDEATEAEPVPGQALHDGRRKNGRGVGVDLGVDRGGDHQPGSTGGCTDGEGQQVGVGRGRLTVGDAAGVISVAPHTAESGKMLHSGNHPGRAHATDEGDNVLSHGLRIGAVRAVKPANCAFAVPNAGDNTALTGARSTLIPAARSCCPQPVAAFCSWLGDQPPCTAAEGMVENPGPDSTCTWPPSWSVATNRPTPLLAAFPAR